MDRLYSLILVAGFSIGMMIQRYVSCIKEKVNGDDDAEEGGTDIEAIGEAADFAQGTGTDLMNPFQGLQLR